MARNRDRGEVGGDMSSDVHTAWSRNDLFRLSYVLGPFTAADQADNERAYEGENDAEFGEEAIPETAEVA
jgi:hypothetical protein